MEALGLSDVLTSVGETLLMAPDFTQPALVTLLTTAGVKFGVQAKLLKSLAASSASAVSLVSRYERNVCCFFVLRDCASLSLVEISG